MAHTFKIVGSAWLSDLQTAGSIVSTTVETDDDGVDHVTGVTVRFEASVTVGSMELTTALFSPMGYLVMGGVETDLVHVANTQDFQEKARTWQP